MLNLYKVYFLRKNNKLFSRLRTTSKTLELLASYFGQLLIMNGIILKGTVEVL